MTPLTLPPRTHTLESTGKQRRLLWRRCGFAFWPPLVHLKQISKRSAAGQAALKQRRRSELWWKINNCLPSNCGRGFKMFTCIVWRACLAINGETFHQIKEAAQVSELSLLYLFLFYIFSLSFPLFLVSLPNEWQTLKYSLIFQAPLAININILSESFRRRCLLSAPSTANLTRCQRNKIRLA